MSGPPPDPNVVTAPFADVTVMGPPSISALRLARWFATEDWAHVEAYRATCSLEDLAKAFVDEGLVEGVRGDIAFCQSVLETGWFSFPDHGQVRPGDNNFAGLGATDTGGGAHVGRFPDCRTGVRAQMQHLRAYATTEGGCDLHSPCVDGRFGLVRRGTGVTWGQYGNGVWATSTHNYGGRILDLYRRAIAYRDAHP